VAEDTPFNQKYILRLLTRWGHQTTIVENGREAMEAVSRTNFDIILMDVQMPEMDGFEATVAIRQLEEKIDRHVPIIAMTAHAMKGDRERCLEVGMDDYVSKPIDSDTLLKTIHTLVPIELTETPGVKSTDTHNVPPSLDKETLLKAFDHDLDFFKEAVDILVSDYPPMVKSIQTALQAKDADTLRRTAHALKGMVGNFQGLAAAEAAMKLEELGRQGNFTGTEQAFDTLVKELEKLEKTLTDWAAEKTT